MSTRFGVRIAVSLAIGALYLLACHWLMTRAPASPWNVVGVLAPMLAAVAIGAWRAGQRGLGALAGLALLALVGQALLGLRLPPQSLYVAQQVGVNLFLAVGFGSTLRAGRTPLITTLARRVHRQFTPAMARYTRQVTLAWTLYFIGVAALSLAIYALASFPIWAVYGNIVAPISVAVMFGAEYGLRYRLHPDFERTTVAAAIRSYMHGPAK